MQLAELARLPRRVRGPSAGGCVHRSPAEPRTPTQGQRARGGQSSWERGTRTFLGNLARQQSARQRKAGQWKKQKILDGELLCCWALTTPISQNSTVGTEPSHELKLGSGLRLHWQVCPAVGLAGPSVFPTGLADRQ